MARLLIVSRSMALAMRLADQHEVTEHPADDIDGLLPEIDADVLVLDVGDAVLAVNTVNALREADQDIPVLLVSGYQPEWEQVEAQRVEGVHVVPLPITRAALLLGIAELVGGDPPALTPSSGVVTPTDAVGRDVLPGPPGGPTVGVPPERYTGSIPTGTSNPTTRIEDDESPASEAPAEQPADQPTPAEQPTPADPPTPPAPFAPAAEVPAPSSPAQRPAAAAPPAVVIPSPTGPVGSGPVDRPGSVRMDPAQPDVVLPDSADPDTGSAPADDVDEAPPEPLPAPDVAPAAARANGAFERPASVVLPQTPDLSGRFAHPESYPAAPATNGHAPGVTHPDDRADRDDDYAPEPDPRRPFAPSRWLRGDQRPDEGRRLPRLGARPRKLQRPPESTGDPLSPAAGPGTAPAGVLTPPPGLTVTVGGSDLERRLDAEAAALITQQSGGVGSGITMRTADLVRQLADRAGDLYGVSDTAQVLADDVIERADADAVAVLVPDGPVWRVSGGVGLRPLERRLQLDESHWLIAEIGSAGRAVLIDDTDIIRQELAGAPLAAWRHLLAVPVPDVRAIVILARGQEGGPFTDRDLTAVIQPAREAAALLMSAVETRRLARLLGPLREQDADFGDRSRRP